jgi:hypothetical protein
VGWSACRLAMAVTAAIAEAFPAQSREVSRAVRGRSRSDSSRRGGEAGPCSVRRDSKGGKRTPGDKTVPTATRVNHESTHLCTSR